jgi:hypothetical protein
MKLAIALLLGTLIILLAATPSQVSQSWTGGLLSNCQSPQKGQVILCAVAGDAKNQSGLYVSSDGAAYLKQYDKYHMSAEAWLAIIGTVVIQAVTAAFVYGKLTQRVSDHDKAHDSHQERFKAVDAEQSEQWTVINKHGERISAVEARVTNVEKTRDNRRDLY